MAFHWISAGAIGGSDCGMPALPWPVTLEVVPSPANQGFSVGRTGGKSISGVRPTGAAVPWSRLEIGPATAARNEHEAGAEEFAGLREFLRNAPGVPKGRVLIGMLTSRPVHGEPVFVDDMKEVAHEAGLGRSMAGFQ